MYLGDVVGDCELALVFMTTTQSMNEYELRGG
jgi:hypothetical protein